MSYAVTTPPRDRRGDRARPKYWSRAIRSGRCCAQRGLGRGQRLARLTRARMIGMARRCMRVALGGVAALRRGPSLELPLLDLDGCCLGGSAAVLTQTARNRAGASEPRWSRIGTWLWRARRSRAGLASTARRRQLTAETVASRSSPVSTMTGVVRILRSARSRVRTSAPLSRGSPRSRISRSGCMIRQRSSATRPSWASCTSSPSARNMSMT